MNRSRASADVRFRIPLGDEELLVPDRPIDIPSGLIARWPLRLDIAGVRIEWATASVAGLVEGAIPTLVLRAHDGIAARVRSRPAPAYAVARATMLYGNEPVDIAAGRDCAGQRHPARFWWSMSGRPSDSGTSVRSSSTPPTRCGREPDCLVVRAAQQPDAARWTGTGFERIDFRVVVHSGFVEADAGSGARQRATTRSLR